MRVFVGVASYARPKALRLCVHSLAKTKTVEGIIVAIDVSRPEEREQYVEALKITSERGLEVIADVSNSRRGSTNARNRVLDMAEEMLSDNDILLLYDDDYVCPGDHALVPVKLWLRNKSLGLIGGRLINLRKRRKDPDFYLNIFPGLAEILTRLSGFIFLDIKHGPRFVDYTTSLMALRVHVIKQGVRYDSNYTGTGYREESDLQRRVRSLGYGIVYEPRFYAYHVCLEQGGNRALNDAATRFYWKARNNAYFIRKHRLGMWKFIASTATITLYASLHGPKALIAVAKGLANT